MCKRYKCGYILLIFEKGWKTLFLALVGLTRVKGTSVRKKDVKRERCFAYRPLNFGSIFNQNSITNRFKNSSNKRLANSMEFDAKGVPK